jgi:hypothetical protein
MKNGGDIGSHALGLYPLFILAIKRGGNHHASLLWMAMVGVGARAT